MDATEKQEQNTDLGNVSEGVSRDQISASDSLNPSMGEGGQEQKEFQVQEVQGISICRLVIYKGDDSVESAAIVKKVNDQNDVNLTVFVSNSNNIVNVDNVKRYTETEGDSTEQPSNTWMFPSRV